MNEVARRLEPDSNPQFVEAVADVMRSLQQKGVSLWSEDGQLRYKAPKGAITELDLRSLRTSRRQIVELLNGQQSESRHHVARAPLAFAQLASLRMNEQGGKHVTQAIASAMSLRGHLDVRVLRQSFRLLIERHDALRTRIVDSDGTVIQEIAASCPFELQVEDLSGIAERLRDEEVQRRIGQLVLMPIELSASPLLAARLLTLSAEEHVLVVVMEHIISDGYSLSVLMRDLFQIYMRLSSGRAVVLPAIGLQFPAYAARQRGMHEAQLQQHGAYWREHLEGCGRLRFPADRSAPADASGFAAVPVLLGKELTAALRVWCRQRQTTVVMGTFAAYAALVLRWCDSYDAVFQYQSDGRFSPKLENTIGLFAAVLYLRMRVQNTTFVELLNQATAEYCRAHEHADYSYLASQVPPPHFTANATFNWRPRSSFKAEVDDRSGTKQVMSWSPFHFVYPPREYRMDVEPLMLITDVDDEIVGDVYFPRHRFSTQTMQRFARNFAWFVETLIKQPDQRVQAVRLL